MLRLACALVLLPACFAEPPDAGEDDGGSTGADVTGSSSSPSSTSGPGSSTTASGSGSASGTSASSTSTETGTSTDPSTSTDPGTSTSDGTSSTSDDPASSTSGEPQDEVVLDLALHACDGAAWTNDLGETIACPTFPGDDGAMNGTVFRAEEQSILVDTIGELITEDAIGVHPRWSPGGRIIGQYDAVSIEAGDLFIAEVACIQNVSCEAYAAVVYSTESEDGIVLGTWPVRFDDATATSIEVEFTQASEAIELFLVVDAGDSDASDGVIWIEPHVLRPAG
jgi:hypothetical protein